MSNRNTLIIACKTDNVELFELYVADHQEKVDYDFLDEDGCSPLHYAIRHNSYRIVEKLLTSPLIDVLQKSKYGTDCLTIALASDETSSEIVKLLIKNDRDFQLVNQCMDFHAFHAMKFDKLQTMIETLKTRSCEVFQTINISALIEPFIRDWDPEKFAYFLENIKFFANNDRLPKGILNYLISLLFNHLMVYCSTTWFIRR